MISRMSSTILWPQLRIELHDKIPEVIKQRHPGIDWKAISGMRVRLAHAYLDVDRAVIEMTIAHDLDQLYRAMESEVRDWKAGRGAER